MCLKVFVGILVIVFNVLIRFVVDQLKVQPTGVQVESRWRQAGDVSESRQVRYDEAEVLGLPSHSVPPWRR